jgi:hypothetical protein
MNDSSETQQSAPLAQPPSGRKDNVVGGIILIVLGVLFLARNLIPWFDFSDYWPLILIAIGAALIWRSKRGS